jgi:hypothetical protein
MVFRVSIGESVAVYFKEGDKTVKEYRARGGNAEVIKEFMRNLLTSSNAKIVVKNKALEVYEVEGPLAAKATLIVVSAARLRSKQSLKKLCETIVKMDDNEAMEWADKLKKYGLKVGSALRELYK